MLRILKRNHLPARFARTLPSMKNVKPSRSSMYWSRLKPMRKITDHKRREIQVTRISHSNGTRTRSFGRCWIMRRRSGSGVNAEVKRSIRWAPRGAGRMADQIASSFSGSFGSDTSVSAFSVSGSRSRVSRSKLS